MKMTNEIKEFGKYADLEQAEKICSLFGGKSCVDFPNDDKDHNQFFQWFEKWWGMLNDDTQITAYRIATGWRSEEDKIKKSLKQLTHDIVWESDIMDGYTDEEVSQFIDWVTDKQASNDVIKALVDRLEKLSNQFIKENGLDKIRLKIQYTGEIEMTGDDIDSVVDQFHKIVPDVLKVRVISAVDKFDADWREHFNESK